ncbi:MAG: ABC transporter ATP-binding protein [Candidatus Doudnabacteria bacterium]|nr:ABC transporter ATP-binding protein [Candidatus Doudnabacteria bacterium]
MKIVELNQLNKIYNPGKENELVALKDINLTIWEGDFVAIMGPSGSGKSTLMNIIGLLDLPTQGEYLFKGQKVQELKQEELARLRSDELGFVFQNFNLLSRTTVFENVSLPLLYNQAKSNEDVGRVLTEVGLADKIASKPNQLSGGQMQRVAIARALINRPSLILADEPTGNLDSKTGLEIMRLLSEFNEQGQTVIMVTHDRNIANFAHRIIHLTDGQIVREEQRIHINFHKHYVSYESR